MAHYQTIEVSRPEAGVGLVTLNRPEQYNTWTPLMMEELLEVFGNLDHDDEVRVVVITGAGKAFCAGLDLSHENEIISRRAARSDQPPRDTAGRLALALYDMKKPTIAAINGAAIGVGVIMTLPMDIRIASDTARFGFVLTRRALVPAGCSTWFLPRIVGLSRAAEWLVTGRIFAAKEALRWGLISRIAPPDRLMPEALEMALDIARNTSSLSQALARQLLRRALEADHPLEAHRQESRCLNFMLQTEDFSEGLASFLEKRQPQYANNLETALPDFYPWWTSRQY